MIVNKQKSVKKKVSIISVTYNSSNHLGALLDSLLSDLKFVYEIIIIDNNSDDIIELEAIVSKYEKLLGEKCPIIFLKNTNNIGFSTASNQGANLASCSHLLFVNPDTIMTGKALPNLISHCMSRDADIIGGSVITEDRKIVTNAFRFPNIFTGIFHFTNLGKILNISKYRKLFYYEDIITNDNSRDIAVDAIGGAMMLVKARSFKTIGGFDERYFMYLEDIDLCKRAKELDMKIIFCPHTTVIHKAGSSSTNKYRTNLIAWFQSRKLYYSIHTSLISNLIIQPLFDIDALFQKIKGIK